MYIPADFRVDDPAVIRAFLKEYPFGMLTTNGMAGWPVSAHLPFLFTGTSDQWIIECHLALVNELSDALVNGSKATMVVTGAHGYVSSSVYTHVNVPTYNYQAVHLSGEIEVMTEAELLEHLKAVVSDFEKNRTDQLNFDNWPADMIRHYLKEIKGIRLVVSKTEAAFKLSQNRNDVDFKRIVDDLRPDNPSLAEVMHQNRKQPK